MPSQLPTKPRTIPARGIRHRELGEGIGHPELENLMLKYGQGRVYLICRYLIMYLGEPAPTKRPIIPGLVYNRSKQKISLSHWQNSCRFANQQFSIRPHFIGFWIDFHLWQIIVEFHVSFTNLSRAGNCYSWLL